MFIIVSVLNMVSERLDNMSRGAVYFICFLSFTLVSFWLLRSTTPLATIKAQTNEHLMPQFISLSYTTSIENLQFSNVLTYVWCSGTKKRWFEFHHFLAIKSALHFLKPDNIHFYYDIYPVEDPEHYNTWLQELRESYPFFRAIGLGANDHGCVDIGTPNISFVENQLTINKGFYIKEDTILVNDLHHELQHYNIVTAYNSTKMDYDLIAGTAHAWASLEAHMKKGLNISCSSPEEYAYGKQQSWCVKPTTPVYPKDIWELEDRYGQLTRTIFYGKPALAKPTPDYTNLIPNIAHIIWVKSKTPIDFLFCLTILSLLHIAKVDKVYIHGESPPTGIYWSIIKDNPKIQVVFRHFQGKVFETDVKVTPHISDVLRADIIMKYGGIYIDVDAIFVKPLDINIRGYEAVMSPDIYFSNQHPFPELLNGGVTIAKKNSEFWRLQMQSMKHYIDSEWGYNALKMPYKIKERNPETILIDPHLQVICFQLVCVPSWMGHLPYDKATERIKPNSFPTLRTSSYAVHWTKPTPVELSSHENLLKSGNKTVFADIGMFVLERSGMLEYFQRSMNNNGSTKLPIH